MTPAELALVDRLLDEVAAAQSVDGSVDAMWDRVRRDVPDIYAMMQAALSHESDLGAWWQDKPHQVLYRIVQLAALRQSALAARVPTAKPLSWIVVDDGYWSANKGDYEVVQARFAAMWAGWV